MNLDPPQDVQLFNLCLLVCRIAESPLHFMRGRGAVKHPVHTLTYVYYININDKTRDQVVPLIPPKKDESTVDKYKSRQG